MPKNNGNMVSQEFFKGLKVAIQHLRAYGFGYTITEMVEISGEDVLLSGTEEIEGQPVDPEKKYLVSMPAVYEMNHMRRLKKLLKKCKNDSEAFSVYKNYVQKLFADARKGNEMETTSV